MDIHVICCNDRLFHAVIGDEEKAKERLAELRERDYEKNKRNYRDRESYNWICYWHIHTVEGE